MPIAVKFTGSGVNHMEKVKNDAPFISEEGRFIDRKDQVAFAERWFKALQKELGGRDKEKSKKN